ncbi:MAG: hypothetical protein QNJ34_13450 [Xenococcaceae cyanobacterium MO_188.B29]|nr:hypothetical protein [Xenococcaceae cyanobacterium MO_188.B29]
MNEQKVLTLKERLEQIKQGRKNRSMNSPRLKKLASRKAEVQGNGGAGLQG